MSTDGGSDPGNRVSHMTVARKQGTCKDQFGHGANTGNSYNTSQAFVLGRSSRGYTFEACNRDGSASSREVQEVVVLSGLGDGRGTDVLKALVGPDLV